MNDDKKPGYVLKAEEFLKNLSGLSRGEKATLRRNAGNTIGESRGAMPTFYRVLPPGVAGGHNEEIYFLVATLYAMNEYKGSGNFGETMLAVRKKGSESIDNRMSVLLDSDFDKIDGYQPGGGELAYRMRQCIKLAESKEEGIDWVRLINDLEFWTHPSKKVQKRWADSYFGYAHSSSDK